MFINFWYPALESAELTDTPVKVRMLGQDFVLWRNADGAACCVSNTCTHRGGSLGDGKVHDGCIQCPYHGWRFDGEGNCTAIPSLGPNPTIPGRTRIDAYPVEERYGLVFCFLGDLPEDAWLGSLFLQDKLDTLDRCTLLAGRPAKPAPAAGKTICACFNVGANTIVDAIREQKLTSVAEIGGALKAGTNCGSCIPELDSLLRESRHVA